MIKSLRVSLLVASSLPAFAASAVYAQEAPSTAPSAEPIMSVAPGYADGGDEHIVTNNTVTPDPNSPANNGSNYSNSPDVLDAPGVNGVGQQIVFSQSSSTGAGLGLCTGTLINPRTVITAAHCVSARPAYQYGSQTGEGVPTYGTIAQVYGQTTGVPISFGFNATNRCLGVTVNGCAVGQGAYEKWRDSGFRTVTSANIYNGNQVFYLLGSAPVAVGGGNEFANGDIALVTLDTHAKGIPTWTLLFSPLDGPAHATITGYGGAGVGLSGIGNLAGIDYRRRSAENMIDALMSWNDQNTQPAIAGPNSTTRAAFQHAIYWTDFDDPNFDANNLPSNFFRNTSSVRNNGYYDFNVLGGPEGKALPREGSTAGGDSGGPLIVDQRFEKPVVVGVLTGSVSYNGGISTYGQMNVYPPLFAFWEQIVQNNPYVYASAKAGNGDWFDPTHWVQDMDPNYAIIGPDGKLLNALPDHGQVGADGVTDRFGTVCYLNQNCSTLTGTSTGDGDGSNSFVTAGGPGSTNFVPNNVEPVNSADVTKHVKARYYDVTLRNAGTTALSGNATIDRLVVEGKAKLDIKAPGALKVWTDYVQDGGWLNVDGRLTAGESLIIEGLLTGTGTFDPTFLTVVQGYVAPGGGDKIGTLTVQGDLILASKSALFIDVKRGATDLLAVTGDADNTGILAINGAALVLNKLTDGAAPKHGDKFTVATATGGIDGTFGLVHTFQGVLKPVISYNPNSVVIDMRAGSMKDFLGTSTPTALAFAQALDTLRAGSYLNLSNVYGSLDMMGVGQLAMSLDAMSPRVMGEAQGLLDNQSRLLSANVTDRLSLIGTGKAQGMRYTGDARLLGQRTETAASVAGHAFAGLTPSEGTVQALGEGVSGFVASGSLSGQSGYGMRAGAGQRGGWFASGLELALSGKATIGTAAGYSFASSTPGSDRASTRMTQVAAYGAYNLGNGSYAGFMANAESGKVETLRGAAAGLETFALGGATSSQRYGVAAEFGHEVGMGEGFAVTPRVRVGYDRLSLGGFEEAGANAALALDGVTFEKVEARMGFAFAGSRALGGGWSVTPQLQADYVSLLSDRDTGLDVRFAAAPEYSFALPLAGGAGSWGEAKGGVTLTDGTVSFGAGFETTFGEVAGRDDRAMAQFNLRF